MTSRVQPLKFFGLAGGTLGSIFASSATLFGGWIVALVYCWKLALVGMCTSPILFSLGYLRLVRVSAGIFEDGMQLTDLSVGL